MVVVTEDTFTQTLLCARCCFKHSALVKSLNIHSNTMRYIPWSSPPNRKGTESLNNLFKDTQQLSCGADIWTYRQTLELRFLLTLLPKKNFCIMGFFKWKRKNTAKVTYITQRVKHYEVDFIQIHSVLIIRKRHMHRLDMTKWIQPTKIKISRRLFF